MRTDNVTPATAALIKGAAARLDAAEVAFGHGTDNARDEAFRLVTDGAAPTPGRIDALLAKRIGERVPVPYLTGVAWLAGVRFVVRRGVVIPRSPIALALATGLAPWFWGPPRRVLDLCCGSGALGLIAAQAFPGAEVDLVDSDPIALALARENVAKSGAAGAQRACVIQSDLFAELRCQRYDLILCNPPYVPTAELDAAPPEFHHEPRSGLDGGPDGLAVWRRIVPLVDAHLAEGGVLVGEAGNIGAAFDEAFPALGTVWLDIEGAEPQADGGFGVFLSSVATRPVATKTIAAISATRPG